MKSIDPHINFNSNISYKLLIKASFKIEKKAKFYYKNTSNVPWPYLDRDRDHDHDRDRNQMLI